MLDYGLIWTLNSRPKPIVEEDVAAIRAARNAVLYGGKVNSLVSWTLSEEWTRPTPGGLDLTSICGEIEVP